MDALPRLQQKPSTVGQVMVLVQCTRCADTAALLHQAEEAYLQGMIA